MTIRVPRAFLVILALVVAAGAGAAIALFVSDNGDGDSDKTAVTAATAPVEDKDASAMRVRQLCQNLLRSTKIIRYSRSSGTTPVDELQNLAARLDATAAAIRGERLAGVSDLVESLEGASESARESARAGGDSAGVLGAITAVQSTAEFLDLGDACTVHVVPTP